MIWPFKRRKPRRASRIRIESPKPAADRYGLALVVIAKNEGRNILDWLAFHALAGVREVILYDNLSTDDTAKLAAGFPDVKVTVIPWDMQAHLLGPAVILPRQILAYCHAISTFGSRFRWMGFIDIDEYIVPKSALTITEALEPLEAFSNISLPWVMFGHGGHDAAPDTPAPFAFGQRANAMTGPLLNFKCIVDPCAVTQVSTHKFETADMGAHTANTRGETAWVKARTTKGFVTDEVLQLNHYYLKSRIEMNAKIAGSAVSGVAQSQREAAIREKAALIETNPITDTAAVEFLQRHGIPDAAAFYQRRGQ
jgi:hypothetical protein